MKNILEKINKGVSTVQDVEKDLKLMVSNAKQYNAEGSEVIVEAEFLLVHFKYFTVLEYIL